MNNNNSTINSQSIQTEIESILNEMPVEAPPAKGTRPIITISVFDGMTDTHPEECETTFMELANECRTPEFRDEKDGQAFCPTVFEPQYRKKANARECAVLAYDLDDLPSEIDAQSVMTCISQYSGFCYSTYSHKSDGKGNRYRVVIELAEPIPASDYQRIAGIFAVNFEKIGIQVDSSCTSPAQMLYFPACPEERSSDFEFQFIDGVPLNWRELKKVGIVKQLSSTGSGSAGFLPSEIAEGSRNTTLYKRGAVLCQFAG